MKRLFQFLTLVIVSIITISCCHQQQWSTKQLVSHGGKTGVAFIYYDEMNTEDSSYLKPYCSGIWVDGTHMLTAFHCVQTTLKVEQHKQNLKEYLLTKEQEKCQGLMAMLGACDPDKKIPHVDVKMDNLPIHYIIQAEENGVEEEPTAWHLGRVVGWDTTHDLALVEAQGHAIPAHEIAELAEGVPATGEAVHLVGHPVGWYWTFMQGTVSAYRDTAPDHDVKGPFLQVQAPVTFGNSGGAAFDNYGKLVGMADSIIQGIPGEALYIPVVTLRDFLRRQHILPYYQPEEKKDSKPFSIPAL